MVEGLGPLPMLPLEAASLAAEVVITAADRPALVVIAAVAAAAGAVAVDMAATMAATTTTTMPPRPGCNARSMARWATQHGSAGNATTSPTKEEKRSQPISQRHSMG